MNSKEFRIIDSTSTRSNKEMSQNKEWMIEFYDHIKNYICGENMVPMRAEPSI